MPRSNSIIIKTAIFVYVPERLENIFFVTNDSEFLDSSLDNNTLEKERQYLD